MHIELLRDATRQMPAIPNADQVTSLIIWHCKYESLASLSAFTNLTALKIASYPDQSLKPLEKLNKLEWLSVLHFPKVNDLAPLAKLRALVSLELATLPSWDASGKRQLVASLQPLAKLPRLAFLGLLGVIPEDKSLSVLEECRALSTAKVSGYLAAEMKRYYAASGVENAHVPSFPEA